MVEVNLPRMKKSWIALIIAVPAIFFLGIGIAINVFFSDTSWWITGGIAIFEFVVGVIGLFIWLIMKIKGKAPPKMKLSPKDAKEKVIEEIKMDEDNPDNFIPERQVIKRVGDPRYPRTPIMWLHGRGSETDTIIDVVVNLDSKTLEMSRVDNQSEESITDLIKGMAENPETISEIQKSKTSWDNFGRPSTEIETQKMSTAEKEQKKQEEEADKANTY